MTTKKNKKDFWLRPTPLPKPGTQSRVGIHTKHVTGTGYHSVHWGEGASYNRNYRNFRSLRDARAFAQRISRGGKYSLHDS